MISSQYVTGIMVILNRGIFIKVIPNSRKSIKTEIFMKFINQNSRDDRAQKTWNTEQIEIINKGE